MGFIRGLGQWGFLNTTVGTTSQSYLNFGFNSGNQGSLSADIVKIYPSGANIIIGFGSQAASIANSGFACKQGEYIEFSPAGINATGITINGAYSTSRVDVGYYYLVPVDFQRGM